MTQEGNWEGHNILHRNQPPVCSKRPTRNGSTVRGRFCSTVRAKRIPPGRDDKVLADWNGMMIAALTRAAFAFDKPDWLAAARTRLRCRGEPYGPHRRARATNAPRPFPAPRPAADRRHARRLRPHVARRAGALRDHRRAAVSRPRPRPGWKPRTNITATRSAVISSPPTMRATLIVRTKSALDHAPSLGQRGDGRVPSRACSTSPASRSIANAPRRRWRRSPAGSASNSRRWRRCSTRGNCSTMALRVTFTGEAGDPLRAKLMHAAAATGDPDLVFAHPAPGETLADGLSAGGGGRGHGDRLPRAKAVRCRSPIPTRSRRSWWGSEPCAIAFVASRQATLPTNRQSRQSAIGP